MDKDNKYYETIRKLVVSHKKYPGYEAILEEIIDDVYSHAKVVIDSVDNESVIDAYLSKVIATSIITVPKSLNFHSELSHKKIDTAQSLIEKIEEQKIKVNNNYVDKMINTSQADERISFDDDQKSETDEEISDNDDFENLDELVIEQEEEFSFDLEDNNDNNDDALSPKEEAELQTENFLEENAPAEDDTLAVSKDVEALDVSEEIEEEHAEELSSADDGLNLEGQDFLLQEDESLGEEIDQTEEGPFEESEITELEINDNEIDENYNEVEVDVEANINEDYNIEELSSASDLDTDFIAMDEAPQDEEISELNADIPESAELMLDDNIDDFAVENQNFEEFEISEDTDKTLEVDTVDITETENDFTNIEPEDNLPEIDNEDFSITEYDNKEELLPEAEAQTQEDDLLFGEETDLDIAESEDPEIFEQQDNNQIYYDIDKQDILNKLNDIDSLNRDLKIREVYELKYQKGLTISEIAETLGMTEDKIVEALNEMTEIV